MPAGIDTGTFDPQPPSILGFEFGTVIRGETILAQARTRIIPDDAVFDHKQPFLLAPSADRGFQPIILNIGACGQQQNLLRNRAQFFSAFVKIQADGGALAGLIL